MKKLLTLLLLLSAACAKSNDGVDDPGTDGPGDEPQPPVEVVTYGIESAVAIDPAGREIAFGTAPRDRKAGIFYFVWLGAHGYDEPGYAGGDINPPAPTDTRSPYDISELEKGIADPQQVPYGPYTAMHHWGRPYLDYYVSNDRWVIRRHAQMLTAAGIDVIFVDLTNGLSYLPVLEVLCSEYRLMRREGNRPPQISFVLNDRPQDVIDDLLTLYGNADYDRLWYRHEGRPLLLAPLQEYDGAASRFTLRYAWFDTQFGHGGNWYGDGVDKWSWGEFSPQRAVSEQMPVMAASHAHLNVGRSFSGNSPEGRGGTQPRNTTPEQRAAATYFRQQFDRVLACDPELVFITGWNEWTAQRQVNGQSPAYSGSFLGRPIGNGDSYFVDCYNHEYSRDIEPLADDFGDTYYYCMVDYVRRFKGAKAVQPVKEIHRIAVDGAFDDWDRVGIQYEDFRFDTKKRDHWGYGYRFRNLLNETGRNDIYHTKAATDGKQLYFYVRTIDPISPETDARWMRLFIRVAGSEAPAWEGFQWVVNNGARSNGKTRLQRSLGGWSWEDAATVSYAVDGRQMEIAIPLEELGIDNPRSFTVDFKWIDNSVAEGDIMECMRDGDSAPDGRFRYRYIFNY